MPNKTRVYLAAVAVIAAAAAGLASVLSARSAGASTAACGTACTSPSVQSLGTGEALAVSGSSVVMAAASTTSSAQDWTPEQVGDVANAVSAGVLSPRLDMLYSTDQLVQYQYAPAGVPSDQCLANNVTVQINAPITPALTVGLTQCGYSAATLWIVDASNEASGYVDLINAGYGNATGDYPLPWGAPSGPTDSYPSLYAEPAVLAVNSSGKVVLSFLSEIGGVVSASQMWADWSSPAQSQLRKAVAKSR